MSKTNDSVGFYVPMDIAPGEFGSTIDYKKLKAGILKIIEQDWGERCETTDIEDFPYLEGKTELSEGRCGVCLVYERFDKFWKMLAPNE
jgi:hypothetical protein